MIIPVRTKRLVAPLLGLACAGLMQSALAQDGSPQDPVPPTADEVARLVDQALPSAIAEDNSALVKQLMGARLGKPISENLDVAGALKTLFGRRAPTLDPDCQRLSTPTGDPSQDECTAASGNASGKGAYTEFSWSKNLGLGNVKYMTRLADGSITPDNIQPVKMSDADAYAKAMDFLVKTMGVPPEEIPKAPDNARNPFPVRDLAVGWMDPKLGPQSMAIRKVVVIQRGLFVGVQLPNEPSDLPYVQAPGEAVVVMDDSRIWEASVRHWRELLPARIDPADAKSRSALISEITETLMQANSAPIASLRATLQLEGMPEGAAARMLPAVQVTLSNVPDDLTEEEQNQLGPSTAGQVFDFMLVESSQDIPEDD